MFGTNAKSNVCPSISKVKMTLAIEHAYIIYSMYRGGEVSVHQACCERATQPYSLGVGGGGGYDLTSTWLPHVVRE